MREAGARPAKAVLEHNTYFDTPEGTLRASDRGLRLRVMQPLARPPCGAGILPASEKQGQEAGKMPAPQALLGEAVVTFKGPRRPGELKIRQEEEFAVSSAGAARAALEGLGFPATLSFEKRREYFRLGGAEVCLDELPQLGFFLEIEAADEATVQQVRRLLGLADAPALAQSYIHMVADHLSARSPAQRDLRF